ncbi:AAA family ATPase [Arthrobacter sp. FW305-123]|nr:AAA family ATPase [Arthrobacter sp. FW305-123]
MRTPSFMVVDKGAWPSKTAGTFTLVIDNWDDYHFRTSFVLHYGNGDSTTEIGAVKIAPQGMVEYDDHTDLPRRFKVLEERFYSLGQDREYYEALAKLPNGIGQAALLALRDVAWAPTVLERVRGEDAFETSLLRDLPLQTVTTQFRRIIEGKPPLTPFKFSYTRRTQASVVPTLRLEFDVHLNVMPPTNVHVLIGANGVGKSQLLRDFVSASSGAEGASGVFHDELASGSKLETGHPFGNAVHVAFSAFDREDVQTPVSSQNGFKVHRVGLSDVGGDSLEEQFFKGLRECANGHRKIRWLAAIDMLSESDPILADATIRDLIGLVDPSSKADVLVTFNALSSGHKIVVLTVTRLIQFVEERSLILIDEPETHLHPPLLSALTRAISDLVIDRNGVAIVATHSPVVLQEVPSSCVWMLQRSGEDLRALQLETETFGESVSRLTSEVFHLDVNRTGYNRVLRQLLAENNGSAERVVRVLNHQLGGEGRFVLSALQYQQGESRV